MSGCIFDLILEYSCYFLSVVLIDISPIISHFPVVQRLELTVVLWTGLPTSFNIGLDLIED